MFGGGSVIRAAGTVASIVVLGACSSTFQHGDDDAPTLGQGPDYLAGIWAPADHPPRKGDDSQAPAQDVWQRILQSPPIVHGGNPRVDSAYRSWRGKPQYLRRVAVRATPFLYHIVEALERRQMPLELALIPVVESGYRAHARSPQGALGLWQLMPATAKHYGVNRDQFFDGRRDIVAATSAALDYLQHLNKRYEGNWLLSLAAYNAGEGNVDRAIRRAGSNDYWTLKLPRETMKYVPKLLALARSLRERGDINDILLPIENSRHFTTTSLRKPVDLREAARRLGQSWDDFNALNAGFNHWNSGDRARPLHAPVGIAENLTTIVAGIPIVPVSHTLQYTVVSGDTLGGIAAAHSVSVADIREVNALRGNLIRPGQKLDLIIDNRAAPATSPKVGPTSGKIHTVKQGDTLWDLAARYRTSVGAITAANNISRRTRLRLGQALMIPLKASAQLTAAARVVDNPGGLYRVKRGDSLWLIAKQHDCSVDDLLRWNKLSRSARLRPGQEIIIGRTPKPNES